MKVALKSMSWPHAEFSSVLNSTRQRTRAASKTVKYFKRDEHSSDPRAKSSVCVRACMCVSTRVCVRLRRNQLDSLKAIKRTISGFKCKWKYSFLWAVVVVHVLVVDVAVSVLLLLLLRCCCCCRCWLLRLCVSRQRQSFPTDSKASMPAS